MSFMTLFRFAGLALAAVWLAWTPGATAAPEVRPDIVLIMADDMGYSDLGSFGGEIDTPHLDALAAGGLRFGSFYSENMCLVSRASLLTGVYHLSSVRNSALNPRCPSLGEVLRAQGYFTALAGKWHLARHDDRSTWPNQRGFDRFFGTLGGAGSFYAPSQLIRDNADASAEFAAKDFYYTDAISDNAVRYIGEAGRERPLFLYVAYTAAHWPLHAFPRDIEKYRGRFAAGWDELREKRFARMKELGVLPLNAALSPRHPEVPAWKEEPHREWQERRMEVYAAQVEAMDRGIGRIVAALRDSGRLENTLVMFMVDNGGCHVEYPPTRTGDYLPAKTRDGRPMRPGNVPAIMPGPEDTYQSYGYGWANLSNTPFRLFKQFDHEGGIRTPMIAHWPKGIRGGGKVTFAPAHLVDILPTVLEITGTPAPRQRESRTAYPMDGASLLPVFRTGERPPPSALYFSHSSGRAIRQGDWKLVAVARGGEGKKRERAAAAEWELYNLAEDPSELENLAPRRPELVAELARRWNAWEKAQRERE